MIEILSALGIAIFVLFILAYIDYKTDKRPRYKALGNDLYLLEQALRKNRIENENR